jgi:hypothetical protein
MRLLFIGCLFLGSTVGFEQTDDMPAVKGYKRLKKGQCTNLKPLISYESIVKQHVPGKILKLDKLNVYDAAAIPGKDVIIFAINGECAFDSSKLAPIRASYAKALKGSPHVIIAELTVMESTCSKKTATKPPLCMHSVRSLHVFGVAVFWLTFVSSFFQL